MYYNCFIPKRFIFYYVESKLSGRESEDYEHEKIINQCHKNANPQNEPFSSRIKRDFDKNLEEVAAKMSKNGENVLYREAYVFTTNKLLEQLEVMV